MYALSWIITILIVLAVMGIVVSVTLTIAGFYDDSGTAKVGGFITFIACLVLLPLLVFGGIANYKSTEATQQITIKSKERVADGDSSRYLVFTEQETFENTDSWAYWKFNSSDVYGSLQEGKTYTCKIAGWRVQFFSAYRNLIECK